MKNVTKFLRYFGIVTVTITITNIVTVNNNLQLYFICYTLYGIKNPHIFMHLFYRYRFRYNLVWVFLKKLLLKC